MCIVPAKLAAKARQSPNPRPARPIPTQFLAKIGRLERFDKVKLAEDCLFSGVLSINQQR
jgi:hypothetical protein